MQSAISLYRSLAPCLIAGALPLLAVDATEESSATSGATSNEVTDVAPTAEISPAITDPDIAGTAAVTNPPELEEMRLQQELIWERLHITAPMEAEDRNGVDPVEQSTREGLIIPASIEQVEAALAAAAATPETKDDQKALDLKQRGSYRYYFVESAPLQKAGEQQ